MKFNKHSCRWCGEEKFEVIVQGPDLLLDLPGDFQFVKCINCGLLRQNPYPDWEWLRNIILKIIARIYHKHQKSNPILLDLIKDMAYGKE